MSLKDKYVKEVREFCRSELWCGQVIVIDCTAPAPKQAIAAKSLLRKGIKYRQEKEQRYRAKYSAHQVKCLLVSGCILGRTGYGLHYLVFFPSNWSRRTGE